ncbi:EamA family transporter [Amycolatopsis sp. MEPSY49]|uniref:EamA family transporter n=1 Tax=Amycolatopsis sp. MEPSY49 TaxID=3151600 RepID=UPI003EFA2121
MPLAGVGMMLTSGLSTQLGAAIGSLAFPVLGPVGVVAVRQCVAAVVLLILVRPRLRSFTRRQWGPVLLLAAVFGVVNLSLYTAIDRIGLGLAVTLEFLGPVTIALAGSRRRVDLGCAVLAVAGVVVLMRPRPSADYPGMGLALLAAACWAAYILLNRSIGQRIPGAQGTAAAAGLSAVVYLPIGAGVVVHHPPSAGAVGAAVAAGLLSSALPFLADLFALRRVPAAAFGLFMSVNPVFAAAVGVLVLGQKLDVAAWSSIAVIIAANAISILTPLPHKGALPCPVSR